MHGIRITHALVMLMLVITYLKFMQYITALSDPRLNSTNITRRTVSHILINVPFTLALAIIEP